MKNLIIRSLFVLLACAGTYINIQAAEKTYNLTSPDGKLKVEVFAGQGLSYQVSYDNAIVLSKSNIDIILSKRVSIGMDSRVMRVQRKKIEEMVESPFYRFKEFVAACNELNLKLKNGFGVVFRAYNDGVAYRFYTTRKDEVIIENEVAEFNFP